MAPNSSRDVTWLVAGPVAHRGLHGPDVPENTVAAVAAARAAGYVAEIDVQLTADGVPVVVHDPDLRRLAGVALRVGDLGVDELRGLRLLGTGARIPTLAEVLTAARGGPGLLVEIKPSRVWRRLVDAVAATVAASDAAVRVAFMSFHPLVARRIRRLRPEPTGLTGGRLPRGTVSALERWVVGRMPLTRAVAPDFFAVDLETATGPWMATLRRRHPVPVLLWTVTSPLAAANAAAWADAVIFEGYQPLPVVR